MAAPITGPTSTNSGGASGSRVLHWSKTGYKQAKPFDRVLPYEYKACKLNKLIPSTGAPYDAGTLCSDWDMLNEVSKWRPHVHTLNRLYDKFKDKMSERASVGVTLAEISQTYGMVTTRAAQLAQFARHLRALRLVDAARTLKLSAVPPGASRSKSFANNYLEFHFGWSPLIADIYAAVNVLQEPIKTPWVRASIREYLGRMNLGADTTLVDPGAVYPNNTYLRTYRYWEVERVTACGAHVSVSNANLWLANQMGLINPAVIAWELVPFSFVVDWFMNVSQVLSAFTDFYGLSLSQTWTTTTIKGNAAYYYEGRYRWRENGVWVYGGGVFGDARGRFVHTRRELGLPRPTFAVRPFKMFGLRRSAAAVSLVVQQLLRR